MCKHANDKIFYFNRWKRIFNLPFFGAIKPAWTTLFYATLLILIILFVGQPTILLQLSSQCYPFTCTCMYMYNCVVCIGTAINVDHAAIMTNGQCEFAHSPFPLYMYIHVHLQCNRYASRILYTCTCTRVHIHEYNTCTMSYVHVHVQCLHILYICAYTCMTCTCTCI